VEFNLEEVKRFYKICKERRDKYAFANEIFENISVLTPKVP
jgi:hypothetical protein